MKMVLLVLGVLLSIFSIIMILYDLAYNYTPIFWFITSIIAGIMIHVGKRKPKINSNMEILKTLYAKGEIDKNEYDERSKVLDD